MYLNMRKSAYLSTNSAGKTRGESDWKRKEVLEEIDSRYIGARVMKILMGLFALCNHVTCHQKLGKVQILKRRTDEVFLQVTPTDQNKMGRKRSGKSGSGASKPSAAPGARINKMEQYEDTLEPGSVDDCMSISSGPLM